MGKQITSPVKKFSGSVTIKESLPFPEFIEYEKEAANARVDGITEGEKEAHLFAAASIFIEKWNLENFDQDNIPAIPRTPVINLLSWLITEIGLIINEVEDIPKE